MRKLTKEKLKRFIDEINEEENDLDPYDTVIGRRGQDMMNDFAFADALTSNKYFNIDPSYDWHGLFVLDSLKGEEFVMNVSFILPVVCTSNKYEGATRLEECWKFSEISADTLEIADKIAEKYGFYFVQGDEFYQLGKSLGFEEEKLRSIAGFY